MLQRCWEDRRGGPRRCAYRSGHPADARRPPTRLPMTLLVTSAQDAGFARFGTPLWVWAALIATVIALLVADLLLVHRTAHVITLREAAIESAVWISLGLAFGVVLGLWQGGEIAGEYYAGFVIEKSLSIDNVF